MRFNRGGSQAALAPRRSTAAAIGAASGEAIVDVAPMTSSAYLQRIGTHRNIDSETPEVTEATEATEAPEVREATEVLEVAEVTRITGVTQVTEVESTQEQMSPPEQLRRHLHTSETNFG